MAVLLFAGLKIANENERFAVFAVGRFVGLKGPGLLLKWPGGATKFIRISLGAEGEALSNELVSLEDHSVPYESNSTVRAGSKVRVVGFGENTVQVEKLQRLVECDKCGNKIAI